MLNVFKLFFSLVILSFSITIVGCSLNDSKSDSPQIIEDRVEEKNDKKLEMIALIDVPEQSKSPSLASINQYKFIFKDKSHYFLPKSAILNEARLGNNSIVVLDSQKIDDQLVVMDYHYEKNLWNMKQVLTLDSVNGKLIKEKGGIDIPFQEFAVLSSLDQNKQIWAFAYKKNVIVISVYHDRLRDSNTMKSLDIKDKTLYISGENKNSYVYYYDSEKTVMVSGNVNENQLKSLSSSLPSINSLGFPFKEE